MHSHDEYAGELEIRGLVYSSCCPILLYPLQNGIPQCYVKYGDEQFPNIEPLRILYHPDQPNQPGHYDILVCQYGIDTAKSVLDQNTVKGDYLNLMKHLCKTAGSISRDIYISEVFSDQKLTVKATAGEGSGCARVLSSRGRTLKEPNVNLSLDYHTQFHKINEVEKTSLN